MNIVTVCSHSQTETDAGTDKNSLHRIVRMCVVADPGFPRRGGGGANTWVWHQNLSFSKIFAKNCMKMKEFRLRKRIPSSPLDPPIVCTLHRQISAQIPIGFCTHFIRPDPCLCCSLSLQTDHTSFKITKEYRKHSLKAVFTHFRL